MFLHRKDVYCHRDIERTVCETCSQTTKKRKTNKQSQVVISRVTFDTHSNKEYVKLLLPDRGNKVTRR